jgi:hypothetical protein
MELCQMREGSRACRRRRDDVTAPRSAAVRVDFRPARFRRLEVSCEAGKEQIQAQIHIYISITILQRREVLSLRARTSTTPGSLSHVLGVSAFHPANWLSAPPNPVCRCSHLAGLTGVHAVMW